MVTDGFKSLHRRFTDSRFWIAQHGEQGLDAAFILQSANGLGGRHPHARDGIHQGPDQGENALHITGLTEGFNRQQTPARIR